MSDIRSVLCLAAVPGLGPLKIRALITHFKEARIVLRASRRELLRVRGIDPVLAKAISENKAGDRFADDQLKRAEKRGIRIVTLWDPEYPELLKKIYDPPPFLFIAGEFLPSDRYSLAIVGTRKPSPYGQKAAEGIAAELSLLGISVVSGLARGIDTSSHMAALAAGGRTIAIIGSGIDVPYPPENHALMGRIAASGVVVSEFPMGTKPDPHHFPRRNRIISGLSLGTLVVESPEDGGAMITAATSLDQNREVFAIPGNIFERRSAGPNKLIREGHAKLVVNIDDILEELRFKLDPLLKQARRSDPLPTLTFFEEAIMNALDENPVHIDALAEKARLGTPDTLVSLLSLEFKGLVKQLPGKMFLRM